jgi:Mannosyl-glycoprotein endo-beta-N-acetylglucosaminidase
MRFYETKTLKTLCIGASILVALFILTSLTKKPEEVDVNDLINESFTREALIDEIKCHGFKYPDLILAQAELESGHFKSAVFKENNNLFGMRQPKKRYTLCSGSNLNHALYDNWKMSVEDRMIYEALYLHNMSRTQYKRYLDKTYATGKHYSLVLEKLIKKNDLKQCFDEK